MAKFPGGRGDGNKPTGYGEKPDKLPEPPPPLKLSSDEKAWVVLLNGLGKTYSNEQWVEIAKNFTPLNPPGHVIMLASPTQEYDKRDLKSLLDGYKIGSVIINPQEATPSNRYLAVNTTQLLTLLDSEPVKTLLEKCANYEHTLKQRFSSSPSDMPRITPIPENERAGLVTLKTQCRKAAEALNKPDNTVTPDEVYRFLEDNPELRR